jgi:hypothetical protein
MNDFDVPLETTNDWNRKSNTDFILASHLRTCMVDQKPCFVHAVGVGARMLAAPEEIRLYVNPLDTINCHGPHAEQ